MNHRTKKTKERPIVLTSTDPLRRLDEFCHQGTYIKEFTWDEFKNGFLCSCSIFYYIGNNKKHLIKETRWVETKNLLEAKRTLAANILENLGLGVPETEEEQLEDSVEMIKEGVTNIAQDSIKKILHQPNVSDDQKNTIRMMGDLLQSNNPLQSMVEVMDNITGLIQGGGIIGESSDQMRLNHEYNNGEEQYDAEEVEKEIDLTEYIHAGRSWADM